MKFEKILPEESKRREFVKKIYNKYFSKYSEEERTYLRWIKMNEPDEKELEKQKKEVFKIKPKISIVVPVYNTPEKFFKELVQSLQKQTYSNWELCLADGSPEPIKYMQEYIKTDNRIKYKIIGENKGISGNTNEALTLATGDFIGLLDHDDLLPKFSLYEIVKAVNENPEVEFIYSDEDKLEDLKSPRFGAFFKPDFSPYTLNSANYICHFSIFKKELMDRLNGFRSEYDGSQDFDIVARASELTKNIVHIPKILYHWRAHRNSTAQNSDSKPYAFEVGKKVIKDHIKRSLDEEVVVEDGLTPGSYELRYIVKGNPKVSVIVDGRNTDNLEGIIKQIKKSTYTNYEIIALTDESLTDESLTDEKIRTIKYTDNTFADYNKAVEMAEGTYFIIIDENLINVDKNSFIEDLVGICQDSSVGIVGTKLYNEQELVEHCGIIIGMNGTGDLLYKGAPKNIGTYMQRLLIIHNVSAVYVKFAMINKEVFVENGMFTEDYTGINISIDTCLKFLEQNKQIVMNPCVSIQVKKLNNIAKDEREEERFIKKWNEFYSKGDIYYSPNLSKKNTGLSLNI